MKWHFPRINPVKKFDLQHYIDHVKEELEEFEQETDPRAKAIEAIDVLQSAEQMVRRYFEQHGGIPSEFIQIVTEKCRRRGYYDE